jgi:flagellar biosynthetic protein FlhB
MSNADRTERPTPRRLEDARRRGQVARSRHLGEVAGLLASLAVLTIAGGRLVDGIETELVAGVARLGVAPTHAVSAGEITGLAMSGARALALLVGPVAGAAAIAVLAVHGYQTGFTVGTEALTLNFGRLNPANGIKQLGFKRGGVETIKAILMVAALAWLGYGLVRTVVADAPRLSRLPPADAGLAAWTAIRGLLWRCSIALLAFAAADYAYQRWQFLESLKMTKQEVKDDLRMTEGSPEVKGRVRRVMNEMFRRRMMAAVPRASVVITNPTHYAVALEYHRQSMAAPVITAMGKDHVAQRIRQLAREHGVPVVENVALARGLYHHCDVGDSIPSHLFEAVAEVLAYLIRLKQLVL